MRDSVGDLHGLLANIILIIAGLHARQRSCIITSAGQRASADAAARPAADRESGDRDARGGVNAPPHSGLGGGRALRKRVAGPEGEVQSPAFPTTSRAPEARSVYCAGTGRPAST